jgi:hypothetical protein
MEYTHMAHISIPDGLKVAYKAAKNAEWTITISGSNHLKWRAPTGQVVMTPKTTVSRRGCLNDIAKLRRAGLNV